MSTQQQLWDYYASQGLSAPAIAGILGNAQTESAFNPEAFNEAGGGQGAYGLFQWRGDRQTGLRDFAEKRGTAASDLMTQAQYSMHEMQTSEKAAYEALLGAKTPEEAAQAFRDTYERNNQTSRPSAPAVNWHNKFSDMQPLSYDGSTGVTGAKPSFQEGGLGNANVRMPDAINNLPAMSSQDLMRMMLQQQAGTPPSQGNGTPRSLLDMQAKGMTGQGPPQAPSYQMSVPPVDAAPIANASGAASAIGNESDDTLTQFGAIGPAGGEGQRPMPTQEAVVSSVSHAEQATGVSEAATRPAPDDDEATAADKKAKRQKLMTVALKNLGIGFGQMSRGETVDLSGYWQARDNNEVALAANERLAAKDRANALGDLPPNPQAAATLFANAGHEDLARAAVEGGDIEELHKEFRARTGDERSVSKADTEYWRSRDDTLGDREATWDRDDLIKAADRGYDLSDVADVRRYESDREKQQGTALNNALSPAADATAVQAALTQMSPETRAKYNAATKDSAFAEKLAAVKGANPTMSTADAIDKITQAASTTINMGDRTATKEAAIAAEKMLGSYAAKAEAGAGLEPILADLENINQRVLEDDGNTGVLSPFIEKAVSALGSFADLDELKELVAGDLTGVSAVDLEGLDINGVKLAYAFSTTLESQGAFTESERKDMAKTMPRLAQSAEGRQILINQMRAMNAVSQYAYEFAVDNIDPSKGNHHKVNVQLVRDRKALANSFTKQARSAVNFLNPKEGYGGDTQTKSDALFVAGDEVASTAMEAKNTLPHFTAAEALKYASLLPDGEYYDTATKTLGTVGQ